MSTHHDQPRPITAYRRESLWFAAKVAALCLLFLIGVICASPNRGTSLAILIGGVIAFMVFALPALADDYDLARYRDMTASRSVGWMPGVPPMPLPDRVAPITASGGGSSGDGAVRLAVHVCQRLGQDLSGFAELLDRLPEVAKRLGCLVEASAGLGGVNGDLLVAARAGDGRVVLESSEFLRQLLAAARAGELDVARVDEIHRSLQRG